MLDSWHRFRPDQGGLKLLSDEALLAKINHARIAMGGQPIERLPQGAMKDPDDCVVARALRDLSTTVSVLDDQIKIDAEFAGIIADAFGAELRVSRKRRRKIYQVSMPEDLAVWLSSFDNGQKPYLIDPLAPVPEQASV